MADQVPNYESSDEEQQDVKPNNKNTGNPSGPYLIAVIQGATLGQTSAVGTNSC